MNQQRQLDRRSTLERVLAACCVHSPIDRAEHARKITDAVMAARASQPAGDRRPRLSAAA